MATASVSTTPDCSICLESLKTPKILTCGHTFCLGCITIYNDKTETIPCPICKQDVKIPEGGARDFTTNYIHVVKNNQPKTQPEPPSTTKIKCPNHNEEVDYYCNNCDVGFLLKCIFQQHKDHETLDIECDETRNKDIEKRQSSKTIIQNRIQNLKKARSTLLESFEQLTILCEDSCSILTKKTEQIVSNLRIECEEIIKDIRTNFEENRCEVEEREMEITSDINVLESNMDSLSFLPLPRLIEIEKLDESKEDYDLCIQYLQWVGKDFILDIYQLGSVISKPFYMKGSYEFLYHINDVIDTDTMDGIAGNENKYFKHDKFRNNNLVWSHGVMRSGDNFCNCVVLLPADNPQLDYSCNIDYQISLLNIDDDSKTLTDIRTFQGIGERFIGWEPITWSKLIDKNNGFLNSNGQFVIRFDIKQFRKIQ